MSLYSNHYSLYTDTVPLIPYILKGYVDYYATSVNLYANLKTKPCDCWITGLIRPLR